MTKSNQMEEALSEASELQDQLAAVNQQIDLGAPASQMHNLERRHNTLQIQLSLCLKGAGLR